MKGLLNLPWFVCTLTSFSLESSVWSCPEAEVATTAVSDYKASSQTDTQTDTLTAERTHTQTATLTAGRTHTQTATLIAGRTHTQTATLTAGRAPSGSWMGFSGECAVIPKCWIVAEEDASEERLWMRLTRV